MFIDGIERFLCRISKRKLKKKITDLKAKHKKKIEGKLKTDIFSQILDLVDTFLDKKKSE